MLVINKNTIQNIPIIGSLLTKTYRLLKYRIINNPFLELYFYINSIINTTSSVTNKNRSPLLIVSLTTIPERIDRVYLGIESLLRQTVKPDHIILWLNESIFNDDVLKFGKSTTRRLLKQKKRGLKIEYCKDLRSFTKIIYTLKEYPEAIVVSADDDIFFPKNWLKELYESYLKNPEYVHCHMARSIRKENDNKLLPYEQWLSHYDNFQGPSNNIFPYTGHGCLFPPNSLHAEVFNDKAFLDLCPNHDDAWFKAMTMMNDVKTMRVKNISRISHSIRGTQQKSLSNINILGSQFDPQVEAVFNKYDLFKYLDDKDPV
ncbi:hypothetical protein ACFL4H_00965 [Candidatus Neomarinimicrobiota bacterium]